MPLFFFLGGGGGGVYTPENRKKATLDIKKGMLAGQPRSHIQASQGAFAAILETGNVSRAFSGG